ncbi:MAG: type II toxin-antitoxin system VapC family toxin [Betaproteobacteria bacterium]|nr:type II toxin-antitoxin system VapC family toxin [Betaproteobacteria bacterium]
MLAVDTNILVRVLVDDPTAPDQCRAAREAVSVAGEIYISQIVQIETVWVLAGTYGLSKAALQDALGIIVKHPAFHLQRPEVFRAAFQHYLAGHADFADCMILAESASAGYDLATFDRKLSKLPGTRLIPR